MPFFPSRGFEAAGLGEGAGDHRYQDLLVRLFTDPHRFEGTGEHSDGGQGDRRLQACRHHVGRHDQNDDAWGGRRLEAGHCRGEGDIKGLALLTDLYDRFGIALPETPTLAEPLTQDEKAALRQLFADWAAENLEEAYALLADIRKQQQTPSSSSEESEQEVGRAAS